MARIRARLRDATRSATTAGYGPLPPLDGPAPQGRTGDRLVPPVHGRPPGDRPIPDWPYTFGQLIDAQADGDYAAISSHDLPILRVHLGADPDAGLSTLERALDAALATITEA